MNKTLRLFAAGLVLNLAATAAQASSYPVLLAGQTINIPGGGSIVIRVPTHDTSSIIWAVDSGPTDKATAAQVEASTLLLGSIANENTQGGTVNGALGSGDVPAVPIPGALWLFGTGLVGLVGLKRRGRAG
jgi:hypothetical protein